LRPNSSGLERIVLPKIMLMKFLLEIKRIDVREGWARSAMLRRDVYQMERGGKGKELIRVSRENPFSESPLPCFKYIHSKV